jgi:hypothetical protein
MKDLSGNSLISRILGRDADEDQTSIDPAEAFETLRPRKRSTPGSGGRPWDFAVELVVETIDDLPSNFPRESAIRIVRRTLSAAGIEVGEFNRRTWARISQISDEMELTKRRDKEFKEKTEEDIRFLEGEIRKAREAYESIHAKEEGEISRASKELDNVKRVRAFFGFSDMDSDMEGDENANASDEAPEVHGPLVLGNVQQRRAFFSSPEIEGGENADLSGTETEVRDFLDATWAQIGAFRAQMRQPFDPDAGADRPTKGPAEDSSPYSDPQDIQR